MKRPVQPCGTPAAYQRHRYAGEDACADCKAAHTARIVARRRVQRESQPKPRIEEAMIKPDHPEWMATASCLNKSGDLWYKDGARYEADAKATCQTCPAVALCLQYAMDNNERWGIWGGHTPDERVNLRRRADYQAKREVAA